MATSKHSATATSTQDTYRQLTAKQFLAVVLRRFNEEINPQSKFDYESHPDVEERHLDELSLAYQNESRIKHRQANGKVWNGGGKAAEEATKKVRLQQTLKHFDDKFDAM